MLDKYKLLNMSFSENKDIIIIIILLLHSYAKSIISKVSHSNQL